MIFFETFPCLISMLLSAKCLIHQESIFHTSESNIFNRKSISFEQFSRNFGFQMQDPIFYEFKSFVKNRIESNRNITKTQTLRLSSNINYLFWPINLLKYLERRVNEIKRLNEETNKKKLVQNISISQLVPGGIKTSRI